MTPMQRLTSLSIVALLAASPVAQGFSPSLGALAGTKAVQLSALRVGARTVPRPGVGLRMQVADEEKEKKKDVEEVTKKYGLEAGLFTALTSKSKEGPDAKELLKKYGSAYLVTSISLALVSFTICYVLVDNGVDVADLLSKVGIEASDKAETAGTVAIAYAAHKAASPIRFPPTVALTPLTAKYLFNKETGEADGGESE